MGALPQLFEKSVPHVQLVTLTIQGGGGATWVEDEQLVFISYESGDRDRVETSRTSGEADWAVPLTLCRSAQEHVSNRTRGASLTELRPERASKRYDYGAAPPRPCGGLSELRKIAADLALQRRSAIGYERLRFIIRSGSFDRFPI